MGKIRSYPQEVKENGERLCCNITVWSVSPILNGASAAAAALTTLLPLHIHILLEDYSKHIGAHLHLMTKRKQTFTHVFNTIT